MPKGEELVPLIVNSANLLIKFTEFAKQLQWIYLKISLRSREHWSMKQSGGFPGLAPRRRSSFSVARIPRRNILGTDPTALNKFKDTDFFPLRLCVSAFYYIFGRRDAVVTDSQSFRYNMFISSSESPVALAISAMEIPICFILRATV